MEDFIYKYYLEPIWSRTGYNLVNTLTYAIIAIISLYFLHKFLKNKLKFDEKFVKNVLAFVLVGSTYRVITDAIDNDVFKPITPLHKVILDNHIFDYGYFTVTPGIYIVTAGLLLVSLLILRKMNKLEELGKIGLAVWLPAIILLLPFMNYFVFAIPILILALIPAYLAWRYFKGNLLLAGIVAAQALDGAATFFVIDIFSKITDRQYFEQHVFSASIGQIAGTYFAFYLLKVAVGFIAAYLIEKEKMDEEDKNFMALAIMILGFAPGIRDTLRMMAGA